AWTWSGNTLTSQPALLDALKTFNTGASSPTPPLADTTAPSTPTNFAATGTTSSSISVSWSASSDNVGVTGYGLYRGGTLVGSSSGTTTTFNGLPCNTSQTLAVDAADAAGNRSGKATLTVSTAACTSGGGAAPPYRFMITSDQGGQAAAIYGYNLLDVGSAAEADGLP